ncbi:MAG: CD1247 N-terminal domain-containing protein [Butyricicoccus sp.]
MTISEKVAYLKGLAEGLDLDTAKSKEGKLISVMIGILEEIGMSIEDLEENTVSLGEGSTPSPTTSPTWRRPCLTRMTTTMTAAAATRTTIFLRWTAPTAATP